MGRHCNPQFGKEWLHLFIDDDRVEFLPAKDLMGLGTYETEEAIREKFGDDQIRSATIGPSGENMVRIANVTNDGRQAGRTGHGGLGKQKTKSCFRHFWCDRRS